VASFEFKGLKDLLADIQKMKAEISSATGDVKNLAGAFQAFNQGSSQLSVNKQLVELRQQMTAVHETTIKSQMQTGGVSGFSQGLQTLVKSRKAAQEGNLYTANFGGTQPAGPPPPTTEAPAQGMGQAPKGQARPTTEAPAQRMGQARPTTEAPAQRMGQARPTTEAPAQGMGQARPTTEAPAQRMGQAPKGQALPFMSDSARSSAAILGSLGGTRGGGLTDVIQAQKFASAFEQNKEARSKIMTNLAGQDSLVAKDLVKAMQQNEKTVQTLTKAMTKLEAGIVKAEAGGDVAKADALRRRLGAVSGKVLDEGEKAEDLMRYGGGMGGGGGPGGRLGKAREFVENNRNALQAGGMLVGAAAHGYITYSEIGEQIERRNINSPYAAMQARAQSEMAGVNREMLLGDPTNGRSLLLGAGDVMFPTSDARTTGLGLTGRKTSETNARQTATQELAASKAELATEITKIGFGLVAAVGAAAVTVVTGGGAALIAGGIAAGGLSAAAQGLSGLSNNTYGQSQGGFVGLLSKLPGLDFLKESKSVGLEKNVFQAQQEAQVQSRIDQMRNDSLETREAQRFMSGFSQVRAAADVKRMAIGHLGAYARSGLEGMDVPSAAGDLISAGLDAEYVNNNVKVKGRQAALDSLNVTASEFGGAQNTLSGSMLNNRAATGQETSQFLRLSRAGLGSMEQLSGNLLGLGQVANTGNADKQLREVLTDAVSLGFTKSPMSQKFVQSVVDLSGSLRTSSTETISTAMRNAASLLGVGGQADIRSLQGAKEGLGAYAAVTNQTTGMGGVLRADALMRSGITLAKGGGILNGMNDLQIQAAIKQIENKKITDTETETLSRSMGLNLDDKNNITGDTKDVLGKLKGFSSTVKAPTEAVIKAMFKTEGMDYDALKSKVLSKNKKEGRDAYANLVSLIQGTIPGLDTADKAGTYAAQVTGYQDTSKRGSLAEQIRQGDAAQRGDVFYSARTKFINQLTSEANNATTGDLRKDQVEQYFASGPDARLRFSDKEGKTRIATSPTDYENQKKQFGGAAQLQDVLAQKQAESAQAEGKYVFATLDNIGPNAKAVLQSVFSGVPDKR